MTTLETPFLALKWRIMFLEKKALQALVVPILQLEQVRRYLKETHHPPESTEHRKHTHRKEERSKSSLKIAITRLTALGSAHFRKNADFLANPAVSGKLETRFLPTAREEQESASWGERSNHVTPRRRGTESLLPMAKDKTVSPPPPQTGAGLFEQEKSQISGRAFLRNTS